MKLSPTVFVVDDRPQILESLKAIFMLHGYTVECFASSAEFIADQGPNQAGCVVVDPLMNPSGHTVLRWLHKSDSLLSIVLISGLIDCTDHARQASVPRIAESPYEVLGAVDHGGRRTCRKPQPQIYTGPGQVEGLARSSPPQDVRGLGPFILFGIIAKSALRTLRRAAGQSIFPPSQLRIMLELPLHLPLHAQALVIGQRQLISHAVRETGRFSTCLTA